MKKTKLLKNTIFPKKSKELKVIGVFGLHSGSGVTQIALFLAVFFSEIKNSSVAFLECSGRHDVISLQEEREEEDTEKYFHRFDICFYPHVSLSELIYIRNLSFDILVIDFGSDFIKIESELLRCDIKILVGTLAPWKRESLEWVNQLKQKISNFRSWNMVFNFSSDEKKEYSCLKLPISCFFLSMSKNYFFPSEQIIRIFQKIFPD